MPSAQATSASPPASLTSPSLLFFHPVSPFPFALQSSRQCHSSRSCCPFPWWQLSSLHSPPEHSQLPSVLGAMGPTSWLHNKGLQQLPPLFSYSMPLFYGSSGFTSIYVILWISLTPSNKSSWWAPDLHRQSANLVAKGNPALSWEHKDGGMVLHTGKICQTYPAQLQPVSPLLCALGHSSRLGFWQEQNAAVFLSLCPLMSARTIWKNNDI